MGAADRSQWMAVLEALDEVEARIPEADPSAFWAQSRVGDVRDTARRAIARIDSDDSPSPTLLRG